MNLQETKDLVKKFQQCNLPKKKWTHEAHFLMAFWYCMHHPLPDAVQLISDGIKKYNVSVGGENTDTSGYHETITLFYIITTAKYIVCNKISEINDEQISLLLSQPFIAKNYLLNFYSESNLMNTNARKNWIQPDLIHLFI